MTHDQKIVVAMFAYLGPVHVLVVIVLTGPLILWARKRVRWFAWELLAGVLPFGLWMSAWLSGVAWGGPGSMLVQWAMLTLLIPTAAMLRLMLRTRPGQPKIAALMLPALCAAALLLSRLSLPEPWNGFGPCCAG